MEPRVRDEEVLCGSGLRGSRSLACAAQRFTEPCSGGKGRSNYTNTNPVSVNYHIKKSNITTDSRIRTFYT
jgi:hypothetical protein